MNGQQSYGMVLNQLPDGGSFKEREYIYTSASRITYAPGGYEEVGLRLALYL